MYFNILHYNPYEVPYEKTLEEYLIFNSPVIDIIQLDMIRTFFDEYEENYRKKLHTILIAIAYKYE